MSLWMLLVFAVFGILLCNVMSYYASLMEKNANPEVNPLYPFAVILAMMGVFLSAICLIKIVREIQNEED